MPVAGSLGVMFECSLLQTAARPAQGFALVELLTKEQEQETSMVIVSEGSSANGIIPMAPVQFQKTTVHTLVPVHYYKTEASTDI
jgi:hypothetical protein